MHLVVNRPVTFMVFSGFHGFNSCQRQPPSTAVINYPSNSQQSWSSWGSCMMLLLVQAAKEVLAGRISQNLQIEAKQLCQSRATKAMSQRAISALTGAVCPKRSPGSAAPPPPPKSENSPPRNEPRVRQNQAKSVTMTSEQATRASEASWRFVFASLAWLARHCGGSQSLISKTLQNWHVIPKSAQW